MMDIRFRRRGSGLPVVLLHGFCETGEVWGQFANNLSTDFTVFTPDLPGFGETPLPDQPFSIDQIGAMVLTWLKEEEIIQPFILGHSLGGYVALSMAYQAGGKLSGIGLFHSTALADSSEKRENRNKTMDFVVRHGVGAFVEAFVPSLFFRRENPYINRIRKMAAKTDQKSLLGYTEAMRDRPSRMDWLATYDRPVLIIGGLEDSIISYDSLNEQAKMAPKGHFSGMKQVGHMGFLENEAESTGIVKGFLGSFIISME